MRHVVTGEAVALELSSVSVITRGASLLLDLVIYWTAMVLAFVALGLTGATLEISEAAAAALSLATVIGFLVVVPVAVETLSRGRSVGKLAFGIRVVRDDGGGVRFRHCLIRGLAGFAEIYLTLGLLPLLIGVFTERGKRLGDVMAGTYAIRARHPKVRPVLLPVPPATAAWAELADIGRIPDELAAGASRLLSTVQAAGSTVDRSALTAVSDRLAGEVIRYVAPAPPATSSVEFLTAVMAERRNREYRRLARQQQRAEKLHQRLHRLPYR
ncbi:RDD family protein [Nesterenkonia sphaerica]|uniref:RDD family protein n=1 Tax=Nesterenkonia sphaerica TaxID=1804988 RepID=A0A5R9AE02_9MICC|nr:RDD family protein [Nesterenkonia sphaerica]TLP76838.1 RDD family protein [Nesterenkonia sphaerica]